MKGSRIAAAGSTNATLIVGRQAKLTGFIFTNTTGAAKFVKFYDKATSPTVGTDTPAFTITIPANGQVIASALNLPFDNGIGYGITGAVADNDTTAVSANDVHGVVSWS